MSRKIKGLGLAFVAIAAMSMVAVSAASASELHATTSAASASIFGQQSTQHVFTTAAGTVKCKSATFEGTIADQGQSDQQLTSTEGTQTATYTECTAFGQAALIDMNGCKYTITNVSGQSATTALTAYVDVTGCTTGKVIEITPQLNCVMTVPQQHSLGTLTFANEGTAPNEDVKATVAVQGIQYQSHGECPSMSDTETRNTGQYTGQATFQARPDEGSTQATHNGHQYDKLVQSSQLIGLIAT